MLYLLPIVNGVPEPAYPKCILNSSDLLTPQALQELPYPQLIQLVLQQNRLIEQLSGDNQDLNRRLYSQEPHVPQAQIRIPDESHTYPQLFCQTADTSYSISLTDGPSWTIGREEDNVIVLLDHCLSRNHAIIQEMELDEFFLIDLGSRNGSFINGRRVNVPTLLKHGDQITLGQTTLNFSCPHLVAQSKMTSPSGFMDKPPVIATDILHVRRLISVLVVDIRNFTGLTRRLDERILSEVVGAWFNSVGKTISHYGSWVDKYIGDAVMAVWIHGSHDVSQEEILQPLRALRSLNEMTRNLHHSYPLPFPLRIGSGLNTGYAMVGNTGSGDRPDYTALGDTVNSAFRLETSTKKIGADLALGLRTYQYLHKHFPENLPFQQQVLDLKGYEMPTPGYTCNFSALDAFLHEMR